MSRDRNNKWQNNKKKRSLEQLFVVLDGVILVVCTHEHFVRGPKLLVRQQPMQGWTAALQLAHLRFGHHCGTEIVAFS